MQPTNAKRAAARRFSARETRLSFFLCLIVIVVRSAVFPSNRAGQSTLEILCLSRFYSPPFSGKAALRSYVEGALAIPGFQITWKTSEASLSPDGRMAYLLSTNAVTMPGPEGRPVTSHGRAVTVWRRGPDADWLCVLDIWNVEPAAS